MSHEETVELLADYALGLLSDDKATLLERHIAECSVCATELRHLIDTLGHLAQAAPPAVPRPELRERVLAMAASPQVWKQWTAVPCGDLHVVRGDQGEWQRVREGVYAKQLYVDPARDLATMLVRMEPGSKYVPHRHGGPEQCFVLQGDVREGGHVFSAGDFQCLAEGSVHGAQWTEGGCLLLIVSSLKDELL
ncbi:MAG TPA: cupin domain-containing protein [Bryobacteraceae bacterium]|nr:cupin domain-containing protein [Bryobacteraceae bacterium]